MRRPLPALAVAATAGLLVAGTVVALPANAQQASGGRASTLAAHEPSALLRGELLVLADVDHTAAAAEARHGLEHGHDAGHHDEHAAHDEHEPTAAYLQVGSVWVPLEASDVEDLTPGSAVTVRVEVPAPVVAAVEGGRPVDATTNLSSSAGTTIDASALQAAQEAPAAAGSPLARASAVAAAVAQEPVAAAVVAATAPQATTASSSQPVTVVAVSMLGGTDAAYSDAVVDSLVDSVDGYWTEQTGGALGFRREGAVTRYSSSLSCSNPGALWNEAAQRAGFVQGAGRHLLLLLPQQAYQSGCSYGLGSVGASPGAGGVAYVSDASWPAIAHELGHNMSLLHADRLQCGAGVDEAVGTSGSYSACQVQSYGDRTDVMSSAAARADGTPVQATGSASAVALDRLGVLASGSRADASTSGTTTWTVQPLSALSGLRSVRVTDPRSGDPYDLEVRAASGRDTFGWGGSSRTTYGLRVLKPGADGGTLLLDPTPTTGTDSNVVVAPGTTFTSASGGVSLRTEPAASDGSVTVQVSLAGSGEEHWRPAAQAPALPASRVQGADRFSTAVRVSAALVPSPAGGQRVFVASGATFPDALAAGAAAGRTSTTTPVLLVPSSGPLPSDVAAELRRLAPARVTVVGGTRAVGDDVLGQLRALAPSVDRISGSDRYATSADAALQVSAASGTLTTGRTVFLATGLDYPDALSGAAAAAATGGALLLTDPQTLSPATAAALQQLRPSRVHVLGGRISAGTADRVRSLVPDATVDVLAGADRYATAVRVADVSNPGGASSVVLATGQDFPDALAGGPLAAAAKAPLLLVQAGCAPGAVVDQVSSLGAKSVTVLGGSRSLSDSAASLSRC